MKNKDLQWIKDNVKSLDFMTIEVCGLNIPTNRSVEAMMDLIPDIEPRIIFSAISNSWVDTNQGVFNSDEILLNYKATDVILEPSVAKLFVKSLNLRSRLIEIDRIEAKISGFDFNSVRQSRAIMSWHETLRGNYTGTDIHKVRTALSKKCKVNKGLANPLSVNFPPAKDYSHLMRVDKQLSKVELWLNCEYLSAWDYMRRFCKAVDDLSTNADIIKLENEIDDIYKQLATIEENDKLTSIHFFYCKYCKKYQPITNGKTPKSCGSKECEDKYKKDWENRKRPPKGDPVGWVMAFGGKRQECQSEKCLYEEPGKRQVNINRICRECFVKP
jgi:hypothetical protein